MKSFRLGPSADRLPHHQDPDANHSTLNLHARPAHALASPTPTEAPKAHHLSYLHPPKDSMIVSTPEGRATRRQYAAVRYAKCRADPDVGLRRDAGLVRSLLRAFAKRLDRHPEFTAALYPADAQALAEMLPGTLNDLNVLVSLLHPSRRSAR